MISIKTKCAQVQTRTITWLDCGNNENLSLKRFIILVHVGIKFYKEVSKKIKNWKGKSFYYKIIQWMSSNYNIVFLQKYVFKL